MSTAQIFGKNSRTQNVIKERGAYVSVAGDPPSSPEPVPQPEFPESPGAPRRGFLFRALQRKSPAARRPGFLCVPAPTPVPVPPKKTTARKSIVGEFARMAGLGRRIGQSEILIDRSGKDTVGGVSSYSLPISQDMARSAKLRLTVQVSLSSRAYVG